MGVPLHAIVALARAGAIARAEALFREGRYNFATEDPAALAVKGRLLKDRALLASGAERMRLLREAGAAYAAADAIAPAPYLLINVATLSALAGDSGRAAEAAKLVLDRTAAPDVAETAYWLAATRSEALLLLGDREGAEAALGQAMAASPDAWTDHAATLRQLGLILDHRSEAKDWLDAFRPPASLHFAGHLGIDPAQCEALRREVDAVLAEERVGFGYGALAAGADIVIAEALIARGAELHLILPTSVEAFRAQSVDPYGPAWRSRFEACLAAAASLQEATGVTGAFEPKATALAGELAMGAALLNAQLLQSRALQLLVVDEGDGPFGDGVSTARDGEIWLESGHDQRVIVAPRNAPVDPSKGKVEGRPDYRLKALLHVGFAGLEALDDAAFSDCLDGMWNPFWRLCDAVEPKPEAIWPSANDRLLLFASPCVAARWALRAQAVAGELNAPIIIAAHYGLVHETPFGAIGPPVATLQAIAAASLPGAIIASETFAATLHLRGAGGVGAEPAGEVAGGRILALVAAEIQ